MSSQQNHLNPHSLYMLISWCDNRSSSTPDRAATGLQNELPGLCKGTQRPSGKGEKCVGFVFVWFGFNFTKPSLCFWSLRIILKGNAEIWSQNLNPHLKAKIVLPPFHSSGHISALPSVSSRGLSPSYILSSLPVLATDFIHTDQGGFLIQTLQ